MFDILSSHLGLYLIKLHSLQLGEINLYNFNTFFYFSLLSGVHFTPLSVSSHLILDSRVTVFTVRMESTLLSHFFGMFSCFILISVSVFPAFIDFWPFFELAFVPTLSSFCFPAR